MLGVLAVLAVLAVLGVLTGLAFDPSLDRIFGRSPRARVTRLARLRSNGRSDPSRLVCAPSGGCSSAQRSAVPFVRFHVRIHVCLHRRRRSLRSPRAEPAATVARGATEGSRDGGFPLPLRKPDLFDQKVPSHPLPRVSCQSFLTLLDSGFGSAGWAFHLSPRVARTDTLAP